jgi:hypothetical protein
MQLETTAVNRTSKYRITYTNELNHVVVYKDIIVIAIIVVVVIVDAGRTSPSGWCPSLATPRSMLLSLLSLLSFLLLLLMQMMMIMIISPFGQLGVWAPSLDAQDLIT